MTKREELALATSCLNKAHADEPVFVLRAQDRMAPTVIEVWADMVELAAGGRTPKTDEARTQARQMRKWQRAHAAKVPD